MLRMKIKPLANSTTTRRCFKLKKHKLWNPPPKKKKIGTTKYWMPRINYYDTVDCLFVVGPIHTTLL